MTTRWMAFTAVVAISLPASVFGQTRKVESSANRIPEKDASQVMITTFKAAPAENTLKEKGLGYRAAEEMRKRVDGAFPAKQLFVVPIDRINPQLDAANFPPTEALESHDARQLALLIRADEYIAGAATKTPTGYRVEGDLVLTRDINARQPLGVGEAPKLSDAVDIVVKEYKEARKQLDGERKCVNAARESKWPEAIQFANAAITAYPKSTLARACLMNALYSSKAPTEEVTKVAKDIVAIDPRSNAALKFVLDAYDKAGPSMSDSLVLTLLKMMQNDPRNSELQFNAIQRIAAATNPGIARPIVDSAVALNGGDPDLLKLRWQILYAMKDFKEMFKQGAELIRLDTSFADTTYFLRTANAYASDSSWKQAAAVLAQGTSKFPTNAFMVGFEVQMLQRDGQLDQALTKINGAIAAKVPVPNAGTIKLQILQEMKAPSAQIVAVAKELVAAGDTTADVRLIILNEIQALVVTSSGTLVKTDAAAAVDSLNVALLSLKEAEGLVKTPKQKAQVAYLMGASNLTLANVKSQQANATKSCQLAKDARLNAKAAMTYLPQGVGFAQPAQVQTALGSAIQIDGFAEQLMKTIPNCK